MQKVLVIGSGYMASEYLKVLNHLNVDVTVIGRGEKKVNELSSQYENFKFFSGGLSNFLNSNPNLENYLIINSVNVKFLRQTTIELIDAGANNILLEKPGDISGEGLRIIKEKSESHNCKVSIAYNRRFYSSLKKLISETKIDGGITSLHIEFTEWIHRIPLENFHTETLKKWILANSSHIIDMAFFLIGKPKELNSIVSGENNISWHPSGSIFTGSGLSNQNIPFTYHSNWESAGRWQIEVQTLKRRFYLRPIEKLQVQERGKIQIEELDFDDEIDQNYKPGLFNQTKAFLAGDLSLFNDLESQIESTTIYEKIGGYQLS